MNNIVSQKGLYIEYECKGDILILLMQLTQVTVSYIIYGYGKIPAKHNGI